MEYNSVFTPENSIFILISFEGPDRYSNAGGLGVRMTELSRALAENGFSTYLYFVGDPNLPDMETDLSGRLRIVRWCQWISKYHPGGVYDGEENKMWDFERSLPPHLMDDVLRPALAAGKTILVLTEDWHTASTAMEISDLLHYHGYRDRSVILWNANNTYGFWNINWGRLTYAVTITTVSNYMKHLMWKQGLRPLVIPNGIPRRMLKPVDPGMVKALKALYNDKDLLVKVGRYDPDKRWLMAVSAVSELKKMGKKVQLVVRGGIEPHRADIIEKAKDLDLTWEELHLKKPSTEEIISGMAMHRKVDILELKFYVPEDFLCALYASALSVLANSGHEPFGIVGLEVMAAGGIVFTGGTGEDYAVHEENAMVLDTDNPLELALGIERIAVTPALQKQIREGALATAQKFTWDEVIGKLLEKLELGAMLCGSVEEVKSLPESKAAIIKTKKGAK
ncbi:MAG: glycosyltransferase [Chloroflexi bacterium]|nr:glycosyltransferase [Chloroflexota bacterium]